jgi:hypothetical protein
MNYPEESLAVIESFDCVTYQLPRQSSWLMRIVGMVLVLFSLLPIGMGTAFEAFAVRFVFIVAGQGNTTFLILASLLALFPLLFVAIGLAMLFLGLYMIVGRDEVVLTPSLLRIVMVVGPLRWSKKIRRERIHGLTVVEVTSSSDTFGKAAFGGGTHSLRVEYDRGRAKNLLQPYPHKLIRKLADDLATRSKNMPLDSLDIQQVQPQVLVTEESDVPTEIRDRNQQPTTSSAILEQTIDGIRIELPAKGYWRGSSISAKFFVFFWCTITSLMVTIFTALVWTGGKIEKGPGFPQSNWFLVLFFTPFVLIGIGGILTLIHCGRKRTEFVVSKTGLAIERWAWFRTIRQEWSRNELQSIHVGVETRHAGVEGSNATRQINILSIEPKASKTVTLLAENEKSELEWIATTLRAKLACGAE